MANKASFYSMCAKLGVACARSVAPHSMDDVDEFVEHAEFPIVAKAAEQWQLMNGRYNVKIMRSKDELSGFLNQVDIEESKIVLQEYIPGEDWIYHGYCNSKANLYLNFTGKKLLDYPQGQDRPRLA